MIGEDGNQEKLENAVPNSMSRKGPLNGAEECIVRIFAIPLCFLNNV